jgi:hypothetical protein
MGWEGYNQLMEAVPHRTACQEQHPADVTNKAKYTKQ